MGIRQAITAALSSRVAGATARTGVAVGAAVVIADQISAPRTADRTEQQVAPGGPAAAAVDRALAPLQALIRRDSANAILDGLLSEDRYIDNPLNNDLQVAYHFRLFVTNDRDLFLDAGPGSVSALMAALDQRAQVTLAESGVTAGISIRDVNFESLVAPNYRTRNVNATKITMTLVEPYGSSFLDVLAASANDLGIANHQRSFYFLELTFRGYDANGNANHNPVASENYPNGGRWVWMVQIKTVDTKIESTGGTYTLEMTPYEEQIFNEEELLRMPETLTIRGTTVRDFLDNMRDALNTAWRHRYGGEVIKFTEIVTHRVTAPAFNGDPGTIRLRPADGERHNERNLAMEEDGNGATRSTLRMGTNLNEFMFANTEGAQELGLDRGRQRGRVDQADGRVNERGFRESVVFRVEPELTVTGFDEISQLYMFEVRLHVWPYYTQAPVLSEAQVEQANEPATQQAMVAALTERGFLRKRYDYIFTGRNTEVMEADIRFNLAWTAVVPALEGAQGNIDATTTGSRLNQYSRNPQYNREEAELRVRRRELRQQARELIGQERNAAARQANLLDEIRRLERQRGQTANEELRRRLQQDINGLQAELTDLGIGRAGLQTNLTGVRNEATRIGANLPDRAEATIPAGAKVFAEDTVTRAAAETGRTPLRISFEQMREEPQAATGIGFLGQYHRDKSLMGAVLEQLYTPFSGQFINLDLSIRGDPFWLGQGNLERQLTLHAVSGTSATPTTEGAAPLPVWMNGDHCFLFTFRYPYTIGDGGEPVIRNQDVFNGVFRVVRVDSAFSEGKFTQKLSAHRLPLIDILKAFGVTGVQPGRPVVPTAPAETTAPTTVAPSVAPVAPEISSPPEPTS